MCNEKNERGLKYDSGKTMYALIPWDELIAGDVFKYYEYSLSRAEEECWKDSEYGMWESLLAESLDGIHIENYSIENDAERLGDVLAMLNISMFGGDRRKDLYKVMRGIADVYAFGAEKYGYDNWREFEPNTCSYYRFASAAYRHYLQFKDNRAKPDDESGILHIYHCVWNLLMIYHFNWLRSHSI